MESKTTHYGKIDISSELLLKWLQFEGGKIIGTRLSRTLNEVVEIIIEHPEMPEVQEGEPFRTVHSSYIGHYGDNNKLLSITREKIG